MPPKGYYERHAESEYTILILRRKNTNSYLRIPFNKPILSILRKYPGWLLYDIESE